MADRSDKPPNGSGSADSPTPDGFLSDVMGMQSAFWTSRQRNKLLMLAVALVAVVEVLVMATAGGLDSGRKENVAPPRLEPAMLIVVPV